MDGNGFDRLARAWTRDRRALLRALAAAAAAGFLGATHSPAALGKPPATLTVCHRGRRTIAVAPSALKAHLRHGDALGPCGGLGGAACPAGANACTDESFAACSGTLANPACFCFTGAGGGTICGNRFNNYCASEGVTCDTDADCVRYTGEGSVCVATGGRCVCNNNPAQPRACIQPCDAGVGGPRPRRGLRVDLDR